jgi:hypothetical protein
MPAVRAARAEAERLGYGAPDDRVLFAYARVLLPVALSAFAAELVAEVESHGPQGCPCCRATVAMSERYPATPTQP